MTTSAKRVVGLNTKGRTLELGSTDESLTRYLSSPEDYRASKAVLNSRPSALKQAHYLRIASDIYHLKKAICKLRTSTSKDTKKLSLRKLESRLQVRLKIASAVLAEYEAGGIHFTMQSAVPALSQVASEASPQYSGEILFADSQIEFFPALARDRNLAIMRYRYEGWSNGDIPFSQAPDGHRSNETAFAAYIEGATSLLLDPCDMVWIIPLNRYVFPASSTDTLIQWNATIEVNCSFEGSPESIMTLQAYYIPQASTAAGDPQFSQVIISDQLEASPIPQALSRVASSICQVKSRLAKVKRVAFGSGLGSKSVPAVVSAEHQTSR